MEQIEPGDIIISDGGMKIKVNKVLETLITGYECDYYPQSITDTDFRICSKENIIQVHKKTTLF